MTNREHLITALKQQKIEYREHGTVIDLLSGAYNGASINLATGRIQSGDVDHFRNTDASKLGLLRQAYSEAEFRAVAFKEGHIITESGTEKNGDTYVIVQRA